MIIYINGERERTFVKDTFDNKQGKPLALSLSG